MSELSADDIQVDFMNEIKDYVPVLRDKANTVKGGCSKDSGKDLIELHRLVHTIRGASSLVKLNNLSRVASEFEEVIEALINKRLTVDMAVNSAIDNTIDYFDSYSKNVTCNDSFDEGLMTRVLRDLLDIRERSTGSNGKDLLSQLLNDSDPDEDDSLDLDGHEFAFDDIDLEADHFVADDFDLADVAGCEHLDDKPADDVDTWESNDLLQQELLEGFYQEAEDHFQDLGKVLGQLEDHIIAPVALSADHKERIRLVRRSVHTIKGAAAVIKLNTIAGWGHEFEDVLDWLYDEADQLTPEVIRIIADATDMLEHFVTTPGEIDSRKVDQLRLDFKHIIGSPLDNKRFAEDAPAIEKYLISTDAKQTVLQDEKQGLPVQGDGEKTDLKAPPPVVDQVKTLRVDVTKVESVVNLAGELTIALSAFDQDMEGLGNLIAETDRARLRLKQNAHDLELGYELKAIRQPVSTQSVLKTSVAAAGQEDAVLSDFDLLELDRYSELNLIIRSLSETAVDVSTISHQLSDIYSGFDSYLNRLRILLSDLHEKSMRMRMTPMSSIVNRMRRTVRETANQLDKKVQLTIHGEHIELDKRIWEKLADPLMHLLRNAIDHGIEPYALRKAAGKPEIAVIHLAAAYQGNQVVIRVSDDGAGLDYETLRKDAAAFKTGMDVDAMTEADLADMIFQSGFSTRRTVSEISGRGVGLDVVRENILGLKGGVRIEKTAPGKGTTFRISLPLTMAVMQALIFDVGGQRYATALYDIKEIMRLNPADIKGEGEKTVKIGGRSLPFYQLSEILPGVVPETPIGGRKLWPLILIVETDLWQGAVAIDRMFSQREIVIKSLGTHLRKVKGIAGATVMGDGKVLPILNLEELLAVESARYPKTGQLKPPKIEKPLEVMVVDDSVSVRTVVSRLMQRQGWHVSTAKDGVEAIERLHTRRPDLIVLDVEMPRMNGYEFMSSIRAQTRFKDTPVIMLTSRGSNKHREKAKALGVNGFVTKPYDDEEFIVLVKRLAGPTPN